MFFITNILHTIQYKYFTYNAIQTYHWVYIKFGRTSSPSSAVGSGAVVNGAVVNDAVGSGAVGSGATVFDEMAL